MGQNLIDVWKEIYRRRTTELETTTKQQNSEGLGVATIIIVVLVIIVLVALTFSCAYYKYGSKQLESQPKETRIVPSEQPTKELPREANKENFDQLLVDSTRSHATN